MSASAIEDMEPHAEDSERRAAAARAAAGIAARLPPGGSVSKSLLTSLLALQHDSSVFVREVSACATFPLSLAALRTA